AAWNVGGVGMVRRVIADPPALDLLERLDEFDVDAAFVHHHALRVRTGDDLRSQLLEFLHRVDGHVARARHHARATPDRQAAGLEHLAEEVDDSIPGRFGAYE